MKTKKILAMQLKDSANSLRDIARDHESWPQYIRRELFASANLADEVSEDLGKAEESEEKS